MVEKDRQGRALNLHRSRRDRCRQAEVPVGVQARPLHHPGVGLLRMEADAGRQAAVFHQRRPTVVCLSIAALWVRWQSCTMIVGRTELLHRRFTTEMPVRLERPDLEAWLSGATGTELLRPAAEDRLRMWPVSRRVNRTGGGDDLALIAEIAT